MPRKSKKQIEKEERIQVEIARLEENYKEIETKKKETVQGIIQRAAYMRITLEDFELDLDKKGFTEKFSQGNQAPYDRKRPVAELYNAMNNNYQKIMKQLTDLLPKDPPPQEPEDGFEEFVNGRED